MLEFQVLIPKFNLVIRNPSQVLEAMARLELAAVKRRLEAGIGAEGPLPRPKDGGRPLIRSGQLLASIEAQLNVGSAQPLWRRAPGSSGPGLPTAAVLPTGSRSDAETRTKSRSSRLARMRGEIRRTARRSGFGAQEAGWFAKGAKLKGRQRGGRNMDVAAILANRPKDKRARAGGRGIYNVFQATPADVRAMTALCAQMLSVWIIDDDGGSFAGEAELG